MKKTYIFARNKLALHIAKRVPLLIRIRDIVAVDATEQSRFLVRVLWCLVKSLSFENDGSSRFACQRCPMISPCKFSAIFSLFGSRDARYGNRCEALPSHSIRRSPRRTLTAIIKCIFYVQKYKKTEISQRATTESRQKSRQREKMEQSGRRGDGRGRGEKRKEEKDNDKDKDEDKERNVSFGGKVVPSEETIGGRFTLDRKSQSRRRTPRLRNLPRQWLLGTVDTPRPNRSCSTQPR